MFEVNDLRGRRAEVRIERGLNWGDALTLVSNGDPRAGSQSIRIVFDVQKNLDTPESNGGTITIHNLASWKLGEAIAEVSPREGAYVTLRAGYALSSQDKDAPLPIIASGRLVRVQAFKEAPSTAVQFMFMDTPPIQNSVSVSSFPDIKKLAQVSGLEAVKFGVGVGFPENFLSRFPQAFPGAFPYPGPLLYPECFSYSGTLQGLFDEIVSLDKTQRMRWKIVNKVLYFYNTNEPLYDGIVSISPGSGLIGSPSPLFESNDFTDPKSAARIGAQVRSMLRGDIDVGGLFEVNSQFYSSKLLAYEVQHRGDTYDPAAEFVTEIIGYESTGVIPL